MGPPRLFSLCARLLLGAGLASCTGSASNNPADATASTDLGVVNDLSPDSDQGAADASRDDALDAGEMLDATADLPREVSTDALVDAGTDARGPVGDAWAGVPLVDLGGFLIPVDPNAVPPPGSECAGDGGVRAGDPTIAPPRPVRPLSVSRVTSQRPTFQWVLPDGTTGARVEVCADRCCTRVLQTFDAEGTTVRPMTALPPGVVFWRMFGRRGTAVGSRASYTWEFGVRRRDAPNDTSWGTLRDFNGDGFDDLVMFRPRVFMRNPSDLLLMTGSMAGLRAPSATGVVASYRPTRVRIGDFNGDGLADITWDVHSGSFEAGQSWFEIVQGSRGAMRAHAQPDVSTLGDCAVTGDGAVVDWNGDGYSDLVIGVGFGCDLSASRRGSVILGFSGSATGLVSIPQWAMRLDGRFTHPLVTVTAGVGDLDNDGYGDIFIASVFSGPGTSSVPAEHAILHGAADGEPRIERLVQPEPNARGWNSGRPAPMGDVDGDGYLDFLVSLNYSSPIYVYRRMAGRTQPGPALVDPLGGSNFGFYFSSGDVNGDGLSDVIVSSELASSMRGEDGLPINEGRVYVFRGALRGVESDPIRLERSTPHMGGSERPLFGGQSVSPGDINGDGIDDVTMTDSFGQRLCARYGSEVFNSGSPDICVDDIDTDYTTSF